MKKDEFYTTEESLRELLINKKLASSFRPILGFRKVNPSLPWGISNIYLLVYKPDSGWNISNNSVKNTILFYNVLHEVNIKGWWYRLDHYISELKELSESDKKELKDRRVFIKENVSTFFDFEI